jgi:hypothetical protein
MLKVAQSFVKHYNCHLQGGYVFTGFLSLIWGVAVGGGWDMTYLFVLPLPQSDTPLAACPIKRFRKHPTSTYSL